MLASCPDVVAYVRSTVMPVHANHVIEQIQAVLCLRLILNSILFLSALRKVVRVFGTWTDIYSTSDLLTWVRICSQVNEQLELHVQSCICQTPKPQLPQGANSIKSNQITSHILISYDGQCGPANLKCVRFIRD